MKFNLKKQKGFTMIELVIVIAVISILSAFALPRFANFTDNSKNASAEHIAGSLRASIEIAKSKYYLVAKNNEPFTTVDMDGNPLTTDDQLEFNNFGNFNTAIHFNSAANCQKTIGILLGKNSINFKISTLGRNSCGILLEGYNIYFNYSGYVTKYSTTVI